MTVTFSFAFLASPCYFSNILSCWKTFPFFGSLIFPPAYPSNVPKCVIFFLYDTRRNPLSAPHPSILSHSLALTHCCGGRGAWKDLDALFRFFGNLLGSASLPAGFLFAGPDLGTLQRIACTGIACMLLLSGVAWLPLFATKLLAQCSSNSMFSVDFGSNPSVIWCRFIFRLIAFAPGAAT